METSSSVAFWGPVLKHNVGVGGQPDSFWGAEPPPWPGAAMAARPLRGIWETYWEPARGRMWFWHEASFTATYSHPVELQGALAVLD